MGSLGKHFREQLVAAQSDIAIARCYSKMQQQLSSFDTESRLLFKLAGTPRALKLMQQTMDSVLGILNLLDSLDRKLWCACLQAERDEYMCIVEALLDDKEWLEAEIGDDKQHLELLTLLKHGVEYYGEFLTSRELDVISATYSAVALRFDVVIGEIPYWFATSDEEWSLAVKSPVYGEERCVRQAAYWADLPHPDIRKFYGAYHVGEAFFIHEPGHLLTEKPVVTWHDLLGCAHGLHYLHERGLVHQSLSVNNFFFSNFTRRGFLSGLGLMHTHKNDHDECEARDIQAFGFVIFQLRFFIVGDLLPVSRPDFVLEAEWNLLTSMCDRSSRPTMEDIMYKIGVLAQQERVASTAEVCESSIELVVDVNCYEIQTLGQTIGMTLDVVKGLCSNRETFTEVYGPVYARLVNVHKQLQAPREVLPIAVVESFVLILLDFYNMLDHGTLDDESAVSSLCSSKMLGGRMYTVHCDIDRLLQSLPWLHGNAEVHCWRTALEAVRQRQSCALRASVDEPLSAVRDISNEDNRVHALTLLQFEASKYYDSQSIIAIPRWFIPPHQLKLGKHIADGAFGAVYEATWLGTDVVVKRVLNIKKRDQFRHELDLWFNLNHANLIKLYGACHEGSPFFVCERAGYGTLASFLKGKHRKEIWYYLWDAAKGLQHLHDHGIVHGDLKGNNILVCEESRVKLADFGLSVYANRSPSTYFNGKNVGAIRWKAPECLRGSPPTYASDLYAFGMCIIEAMTGKFPWGNMTDMIVKYNVLERETIPSRPHAFSNSEWELVTRLCHIDPQRRISIGAATNIIYKLSIN